MQYHNSRHTKLHAFTLVEMIVVVAIISLLLAILLPALSGARASAKSIKCLSNLKQLANGFHLYAQDNEGFVPGESLSMGWDFLLRKYIPADEVYLCPADIEGIDDGDFTSYAWRDYFEVDSRSAALSGKKLLNVLSSKTIIVFDSITGWHAENQLNVARLDTSAISVSTEEFEENMQLSLR